MSNGIIVKDIPFSNSTTGYHVYKGNGIIMYVSRADMTSPPAKVRVTIEPA